MLITLDLLPLLTRGAFTGARFSRFLAHMLVEEIRLDMTIFAEFVRTLELLQQE